MSREEDFQTWIKAVMPRVIESLGPDIDDARYDLIDSRENLMSSHHSVRVWFTSKATGRKDEIRMILKKPDKAEELFRYIYKIDCQYHNEILFYRTYVQPGDNFARCYYVDERPPVDTVIALEDVVDERGYSPAPFLYNAPMVYTVAIMREMGRFHGKGYVMKELQRERFFDIVRAIRTTRYDDRAMEHYEQFININAMRAVDYLRDRGYDPAFCDKVADLFANGYNDVMLKIAAPSEPLATLCHGDLTLSNAMFKRENETGRYRALLIDFANLMYATPVVDLSTYVFLYCFNDESKGKFYDIVRAYHDALKEYLSDAGIWDGEKYSYNAILDDYRRGCLFGFLVGSCYITVLMGYTDAYTHKMRDASWGEFSKLVMRSGGDEASKILADILLHLRDLGCLKHFLNI